MRHLKRGKDFMIDINKFVTKLKSNFNEFIKNIQTEGRETKELFDLLLKESRGELYDENGHKRHLTTEEKNKIKDQAGDIFKVLGLTSLSILPGGTLVFILLKVFKQEDKILPSSFLSEEQKRKKSDTKK
jgi:hypothetical protein